MKKIFVDKNEGVAEVVEKIIGHEESTVVLVVPKNAELGESVSNFHLIKREADAAEKHILVESVDEVILALAKSSKIEAVHPLFSAGGGSASGGEGFRRSSAFSDIVPREAPHERAGLARKRKKLKEEPAAYREPGVRLSVAEEEEAGVMGVSAEASTRVRQSSWWTGRHILLVVIFFLVLGGAVWLVSVPLSRATVSIDFDKTPWVYDGKVLADTSVAKVNFNKSVLPAELFTSERNLTQFFPASGKEKVAEKATGKILIYNAYSSKSQILVATTRFETPDGKVFRILERVRVPGAEIKDGNIIPASIEVDIVADKPGEDYNIGPVAKLSVPGFKGSPRFAGFYGEIKEPAKGGFIGEKAVPTSEDIKNAKDRTSEILRTSLQASFIMGYPDNFKVLEGVSDIEITRLSINESTDQNGNFSVFGEAVMRAIGFREEDLKLFLKTLANKENPGTAFKELNLEYSDVKLDFEDTVVAFSLSAEGILWPNFSPDEFRESLLGKSLDEARSLVAGLEGLSSAKVSLWPIWLGSIPSDSGKVKIVVE